MPSLREQLAHALDADVPHGLLAWVRGTPAQHAFALTRGKEAEALREVQAILANPSEPSRVRCNAVALLTQLFIMSASVPSAEEIYSASRKGQPFDPQRPMKAALTALLGDRETEVRIAAAISLLQWSNAGDLPALRVQLADLLPMLRSRKIDSPQVQQALLALGGTPDVLAYLNELAMGSGPLPPDLEATLAALEREPHEAAAEPLARIFPRLDAIAERHEPARETIGGAVPVWDGLTMQALYVFRAYARMVPRDHVAAAAELLRAATPAMAAVLIGELDHDERGAAAAGAAAGDATLGGDVRIAAVRALAAIARDPKSKGTGAALERLQRLRDDADLGVEVRRALAVLGAARS